MTTIAALQRILSVEGLPNTIVTDNGAQFTSSEFKQFCKNNSIDHLTTAPFHPSSNGLAERYVRTFKQAFKKIMMEEGNAERALYKYLATYRSTPNPRNSKSPAEMLHGRQPRTILSALFPTSTTPHATKSKFTIGNSVWIRSYSGPRWIQGKISKVQGNRMYVVESGSVANRRHQDQIRAYTGRSRLEESDPVDIDLQATDEISRGENEIPTNHQRNKTIGHPTSPVGTN
ncbi:uncharacterized protein K02A2.6-like [Rhagoletis pomonella]|uniref:uncharacterized protein K02A2.6-like n=1 Tax=Rhagoletis pomonella TaxID=28610 RepID=UPI0017839F32|nr:uncharacterized protein K02A2.6-like [Rhagoletis pomonella]